MIDFDLPLMAGVHQELETLLVGGIIRNVYQPDADTLLLVIRQPGQTHHLLLSAHFAWPRLHLTTQVWPRPSSPSPLCMLFRKYLRGMQIQAFLHPPDLPVFQLVCAPRAGEGREAVSLIGEFVAKYSNLLLVNRHTGNIIESVKHPLSPFRQIAPHLPYT
ncbi:MAG: hypothetical protein D6736_21590, partial [Nitrospinota bacterium]